MLMKRCYREWSEPVHTDGRKVSRETLLFLLATLDLEDVMLVRGSDFYSILDSRNMVKIYLPSKVANKFIRGRYTIKLEEIGLDKLVQEVSR